MLRASFTPRKDATRTESGASVVLLTRRQLLTALLALSGIPVLSGIVQARAPDLAELAGQVLDMGTGQPIAGARIRAAGYHTSTNAAGRYTLVLPAGQYDLRVEAPGYIGMTRTLVRLGGGSRATFDFETLPEHPTSDESTVINSKMLKPAEQVPTQEEEVRGFGLSSVTVVPTTIRVLIIDSQNSERDHTVITLNMDEYLKGVVPHEMPHSWSLEGLKAQAVAARSYAATAHKHVGQGKNGEDADVCNTTDCQVWDPLHYDSTDAAVDATHGMVATYNKAIIHAFFFASCAGHTYKCNECQDPAQKPWECWSSDLPYIQPVTCDPSVERIAQSPGAYYSQQHGHGHGMCQVGAADYGDPNKRWRWGYVDILKHFYTGVTIEAPIRIVSPGQGAIVRGTITAPVESSGSPVRVDCFVDGLWRTWTRQSSFVWKISTVELPDGPHTLKVVATLADGQTSLDEVPIVVDNAPPGEVGATVPPWSTGYLIPFHLTAQGATKVQFSNGWLWDGAQVYEPYHESKTGQVDSTGTAWFGRGGRGGNKAGFWYGPYTCDLPSPGDYQVYFRMKTPDRTLQGELAVVDVSDGGGSNIYAQRSISAEDFARNDTYEEFRLNLAYPANQATCGNEMARDELEFRTQYRATGDLYLERISVFSAPAPFASDLYWNVRSVEGAQTVVVRFLDDAGNAQDVPVTVRVDTSAPRWLSVEGPVALVQDAVSGLDTASAAWSASTDGGHTWSAWQPFNVTVAAGVQVPIQLQAPEITDATYAFRIKDLAGNTSFSNMAPVLWLPLIIK